MRQIFGFLNIINYIQNTNWASYVAVFYVAIAVLLVAIVGIFYTRYSSEQRNFSFTWPLTILRNILWLFSTALYLPYLSYLVSILACVRNQNRQIVHSLFSEVVCWQSDHIVHAVIAILGIITFATISFATSLTYFEYKSNANDPTSRYFFSFLNHSFLFKFLCSF